MAAKKPATTIRAYVMLRPPSGEKPAVGASQFIPSQSAPETIHTVKSVLTKLGFQVVGSGSNSVTIEGDRAAFRKVFGSAVRSFRQPPQAKGSRLQSPPVVHRFSQGCQIPDELKPYASDVVFPAATSIHD
jgi:subtilase family serine protease